MGIIAKFAYAQGMTVGTLLAYRFVIAAVLFWLWIALTRPVYRLTWRERGLLAAMGAIGYAGMATLMFSSFYYMSASIVELLFYSYPTLVCLLTRLVDKEPITAHKGIVLAAGFVGLLLVLIGPAGTVSVPGVIMAFTTAVMYAAFIVLSNRLIRNVTPLVSSAHITTSSAAALVLFAAFQGDLQLVREPASWAAIAGVAVFSTVVAVAAFFAGVKRIGSTRASMLSTLEPVVTLACSAVLFHERLRPLQWLGVTVVLVSLVAMELRISQRRQSSSPAQTSA